MKNIFKIFLTALFACLFSGLTAQITSSRGTTFCEGNSTTLTLTGASGNNYVWTVRYGTGAIDTLRNETGSSVDVVPHFFGNVTYKVYNEGESTALGQAVLTIRDCCSATADFAISKVCNSMTIDGDTTELEWAVSAWKSVDRLSEGSALINPAGKWKMLYDNENIYLYIIVYDNAQPVNNYWNAATLENRQLGWQGDAVEIFADAGNCGGNYPLQIGLMYPATGTTPGTYNNTNCTGVSFIGYQAVVKRWSNGSWAMEVKFPAVPNGINLNGNSIKIEVGINQSTTGSARVAQFHSFTNSNLVYQNKNLLHTISLVDCASTRASAEVVCGGAEVHFSTSIKSANVVPAATAYTWQKCYSGCDDNSVGSANWTNVIANTAGDVTLMPDFNGGDEVYFRAVYNNEIAACPIQIRSSENIEVPRAATICSGKSYNFYGDILTRADVYTKNVPSTTGGCDSIITLTLTITPNIEVPRTATICSGKSYNFYGDILTRADVYTKNVPSTTGGCDSTITLTLTLTPNIEIEREATICYGDTYNFYGTPLTRADVYTKNVPSNTGGCDSTITLTLIVIPIEDFGNSGGLCECFNIIEQKWNDVLALLNGNANAGNYNFTPVSYKWFKNNWEIASETKSYIYLPEGLDFTARYNARIVTAADGEVTTCIFQPQRRDINSETIPQIASADGVYRVIGARSQQGAMSIYSVSGVLVGSQAISADANEITIPLRHGMYIVQIIYQDGTRQVFKAAI